MIAGLTGASLVGCASSGVAVPHREFSGFVESVAVRVTLQGIEVFDNEACPWIDDHVLLVLSTEASVDPDGPVLVSEGERIAVGDGFETSPPVPLVGGYACGGMHWDQAVQLPSAPKMAG